MSTSVIQSKIDIGHDETDRQPDRWTDVQTEDFSVFPKHTEYVKVPQKYMSVWSSVCCAMMKP